VTEDHEDDADDEYDPDDDWSSSRR
jgi:hypothetical protein